MNTTFTQYKEEEYNKEHEISYAQMKLNNIFIDNINQLNNKINKKFNYLEEKIKKMCKNI